MERLKNPREFSLVYSQGTPCFGKYIVVSILPTKSQVSRVGFAVSKKIGNAVMRNKIKRRLRAIMQDVASQVSPGYDLVIGAKRSATSASFSDLDRDLRLALKKGRVFTDTPGENHA